VEWDNVSTKKTQTETDSVHDLQIARIKELRGDVYRLAITEWRLRRGGIEATRICGHPARCSVSEADLIKEGGGKNEVGCATA